MRIGVFDSGIGGLIIAKALIQAMPQYDYLYYGDTKNLPYGEKSNAQITQLCINAIEHMIQEKCALIILACNTASAVALRYIQQQYLPKHHPHIKVLGVVIPTLEEAVQEGSTNIGVIATQATTSSQIYSIELKKINKELNIQEVAAPKLVPAIEANNIKQAQEYIKEYKELFSSIDSLILGCTHYPLIKNAFQKEFKNTKIIAPNDFMGKKLQDYLKNHPEIENILSKNHSFELQASLSNKHYESVAKQIFPTIKINCLSSQK